MSMVAFYNALTADILVEYEPALDFKELQATTDLLTSEHSAPIGTILIEDSGEHHQVILRSSIEKIVAAKWIVKHSQYLQLFEMNEEPERRSGDPEKGVFLDGTSANLMVQVWDALDERNRRNALGKSLTTFSGICWKIMTRIKESDMMGDEHVC